MAVEELAAPFLSWTSLALSAHQGGALSFTHFEELGRHVLPREQVQLDQVQLDAQGLGQHDDGAARRRQGHVVQIDGHCVFVACKVLV